MREHALCEIFEVYLMNNPDPRRNELESFERLLSPLEKLVALAVALELHIQVELQSARRTEEIHLHRVIDHQINGHKRLDNFRIGSEPLHSAAHGREINNQRNS